MTSRPICVGAWMADRPPAGTEVCRLSVLPDGGGRMFVLAAPSGEFRLLVLRSGAQCFGYENRCPHFGIPLAERDDQLILKPHQSVTCNTHYARFRWQDGYCESGDCAGDALVPVALRVDADVVCLA